MAIVIILESVYVYLDGTDLNVISVFQKVAVVRDFNDMIDVRELCVNYI